MNKISCALMLYKQSDNHTHTDFYFFFLLLNYCFENTIFVWEIMYLWSSYGKISSEDFVVVKINQI